MRLGHFMQPEAVLRLWDVVNSFQPGEAEERIESWCATGGVGVESDWTRAELEEHVRDEHSTFTWLLEPTTYVTVDGPLESRFGSEWRFSECPAPPFGAESRSSVMSCE